MQIITKIFLENVYLICTVALENSNDMGYLDMQIVTNQYLANSKTLFFFVVLARKAFSLVDYPGCMEYDSRSLKFHKHKGITSQL